MDIKALAQKVSELYAQGRTALDADMIDALNALGEQAGAIAALADAKAGTDDVLVRLRAAIASQAVTFSEVVSEFAAARTPDELALVAKAREMAREGEIEVDDTAIVSAGDDPGAYVMAWMWVDTPVNVDAITDDMLAEAARNPDLDAALQPLMEAAKIDTGDVAGAVFSGRSDQWPSVSEAVRMEWLRDWREAERRDAE